MQTGVRGWSDEGAEGVEVYRETSKYIQIAWRLDRQRRALAFSAARRWALVRFGPVVLFTILALGGGFLQDLGYQVV